MSGDTEDVRAAWRAYDEKLRGELGLPPGARVESYSAGTGEAALILEALDAGLIYLMNSLVLHAAGYGVLIDRTDPPTGTWLKYPPGHDRGFDELEHEEGLGRIETPLLGAVLSQLREAEHRLATEYEQRVRLNVHKLNREQIDALVTETLTSYGRAHSIGELAEATNLTRAQASSAIMRLGPKVHRTDDGRYELIA